MRKVDELKAEAHRLHIVEAAARCCSRLGVARTTNRDIATEAGMRASHIYYYFKSKDAILQAVLEYGFDDTLSRVEHLFESADLASAIIDLHKQAEAERNAVGVAARVRVELQCYFATDEHRSQIGDEMKQRLAGAIKNAARAAVESGRLPGGIDIDALTDAVILIWHGLTFARLYSDFDLDAMKPAAKVLIDGHFDRQEPGKPLARRGRRTADKGH